MAVKNIIDITNKKCIFNNNEIIYILDEENNPWFYANMIAEILEYKRPRNAISSHVKEKNYKYYENFTSTDLGRVENIKPNTIFINESGLYQLIMKSKMDIAEQFQDWVFEEVLPSIRKNGEYKIRKELNNFYTNYIKHKDELIQIKDNHIKTLQTTSELAIKVMEKRNDEISQMKPNLVPETNNKNLLNMFTLIKTYNSENYEYYVIRCQRRRFKAQLKNLKNKFPNMKILLKLTYNPNSINLYNRMKETLKDKINWEGNYFDITDDERYCEEDLLYDIQKLYNPFN